MPRKSPANAVKRSATVKSAVEVNDSERETVEDNLEKKMALLKKPKKGGKRIPQNNATEEDEVPEKKLHVKETSTKGRKKTGKEVPNGKQENITEENAVELDEENAEPKKQTGRGRKMAIKNNNKKIKSEDKNNMIECETKNPTEETNAIEDELKEEESQEEKSDVKRGKVKLQNVEEGNNPNPKGRRKIPPKNVQEIKESNEKISDSKKPASGPKSSRKRKNSESEKLVEDNAGETEISTVKKNKQQEKLPAEELESDMSEKPKGRKAKGKTTSIPKKAGNKSTRGAKGKEASDDDFEEAPKAKIAKKEKIADVSVLDFSNSSKSPSGKLWNLKISSWNINGIRAWLEKNGFSYLTYEKPDIVCVQETKCSDDKLPDEVKNVDGYHTYWLSGDKDGYSGIGLLSKEKPIDVKYGIGIEEHDNEGRVITAEYKDFYLVTTYVPNAGRGLVRLDYRQKWDKDFRAYLKKLDSKKPVILCGDLNVAHEEIDIARPKSNKRNAGFTVEEREGFSALLKEGFVDTFRHLYPDTKDAYTFWTYMMNARGKNIGWRLDYFVISEKLTDSLCDSVIRKDVFGSDHCPVALFLAI
ncbi:DNA-(apurinic or apyrimidinic site) endonuclease-like [Stegodyphus dumicola]|uniref:DNA-(apurinic or apyrimidinic site) endonuclease-like n=1 Tax=Stegodyphus dumicola TaxID=202533 RepID=UPI0015B0DC33|nr:DNA-(apurinic or apyrimidinic site) endonuclease-like [Stegodyphus dumicola]